MKEWLSHDTDPCHEKTCFLHNNAKLRAKISYVVNRNRSVPLCLLHRS